LGGAMVHSEITGNAHFFAKSEVECFEQIKKLITFIPWNNEQKALKFPVQEPLLKKNIDEIVIHTLNNRLSDDDKKQLIKDLQYAPDWIANIMRTIANQKVIK